MKSNNENKIKKAFNKKFNTKDDYKHLEQMLSYRLLSEIEKITDERDILRKDLAKMIKVSPSYITQLYTGNKIANLEILAKIEEKLDFRFEVRAVAKEIIEINESEEYLWTESQANYIMAKIPPTPNRVWMMKNLKKIDVTSSQNTKAKVA